MKPDINNFHKRVDTNRNITFSNDKFYKQHNYLLHDGVLTVSSQQKVYFHFIVTQYVFFLFPCQQQHLITLQVLLEILIVAITNEATKNKKFKNYKYAINNFM